MSTQNLSTENDSEKKQGSGKGAAFSAMIAALAASSCCIPPVIAALAGVGGIAGSLSWVEPFRPYLIGIAVLAIGYAWYNHYQRQKPDDCCAVGAKPKWYQTKGFLVGVSIFAAVSIAFPYYSQIFFPTNDIKEIVIVNASDVQTVTFDVKGMTCTGCEAHVSSEVNKLPGIVKVDANYEEATAKVQFDQSKVSLLQIEEAINSTGYKVVDKN
ncbi:MAG: mercuric transport protein MerTP [Flavobacteriaceae bacterium]